MEGLELLLVGNDLNGTLSETINNFGEQIEAKRVKETTLSQVRALEQALRKPEEKGNDLLSHRYATLLRENWRESKSGHAEWRSKFPAT